ncbi:MAG TPA: hypothetical protein VE860_24590 [Chthoniobacterales bacterium]|nr:hypothetical protein [Chthoniobacterales bacterium]
MSAKSPLEDEAKLVPTTLFAIFVVATLLLLAGCAGTNNGKSEDPVVFGTASGANGGAGATTGVSLSW